MSLSSILGKPSGYVRICPNCGARETNGKVGTWLTWYKAHLDCTRKEQPSATDSAVAKDPIAKAGSQRVSLLYVSAQELGLICDTYSADLIAAGKSIKKYEHEGRLYTCTATNRGYDANCWELTPLDQWDSVENDEPRANSSAREVGREFYDGMKAKVGKRDFVMTGPMTVFAVEEIEE